MKKVGLVVAKGEGRRIAHCLRSMSQIVDEIVYLDDNSPDDTLEHVMTVADECRVVRIMEQQYPMRDEGRDRNKLLRVGRDIGGESFLVLDADEAFAANACFFMQVAMDAMQPGDTLGAKWTHPWRSIQNYRVDSCPWVDNWRAVAFCDDGRSWYPNLAIHTPRTPFNHQPMRLPQEIVLLHFQFISWDNVVIKQAWYKFVERLLGGYPADYLNHIYHPMADETGLRTEPIKAEWLHSFFDENDFKSLYWWRVQEMRAWLRNHADALVGLGTCPFVDQTALAAVVNERGRV